MSSRNRANNKVCAFCNSEEDNEIEFGKLIVSDEICMHTYCMYFASGLSQKGDESDRYFGFLLPDIKKELNRGRKLFCPYCRKRGATIGCCFKSCKKSFHLKCGLKNGSLNQYYGFFYSYCKNHKPKQTPLKVEGICYCYICCESVKPEEIESCLYAPCCKQNYFHKICLQKYALSAGRYCFKCPLCNNSTSFVKEMKTHGINIPEKDASWELEENAYQELLVKPECSASTCLCPNGRKYCSLRKSGWSLVTCSYCGYRARHRKCEKLKMGVKRWLCIECTATEKKLAAWKKNPYPTLKIILHKHII